MGPKIMKCGDLLYFFIFSSNSLEEAVPLNVWSYVSTTTCLMWLSICSSFYNSLEDTSWNKSCFVRVDGNRVSVSLFYLDLIWPPRPPTEGVPKSKKNRIFLMIYTSLRDQNRSFWCQGWWTEATVIIGAACCWGFWWQANNSAHKVNVVSDFLLRSNRIRSKKINRKIWKKKPEKNIWNWCWFTSGAIDGARKIKTWKLVLITEISTSQDYKTSFKWNVTCTKCSCLVQFQFVRIPHFCMFFFCENEQKRGL